MRNGISKQSVFHCGIEIHSGNNYTVDCIKTFFSILNVTQSGGHITIGYSGICSAP
jgi:hypothetical protein